jgi:phosphoglycerate dehydrogenase-like enzyme
MDKIIYVTEPDVIDVTSIAEILPVEYDIVQGNTSFEGGIPSDCSILVIRSATTINSSIKEKIPKLKHIIRVGTGIDSIDIEFCNTAGIAVYNAPGANADAVSDYIVAMMFVALRKINLLTKEDTETWNRFKFTGHSMSSRSIGIIGFGNIGKQIFHKLQGFNCKSFVAYDPFVKAEDMPDGVTYASSIEEVLKNSDIVTLHVPLIPSTQYLINKNNLKLLSKGAILLNASRGGIVNETEISEYIHENNLVYIADTVENEPKVAEYLLNNEQIIVTPHIASLTEESEVSMVEVALQNFLNDKPMNQPAKLF